MTSTCVNKIANSSSEFEFRRKKKITTKSQFMNISAPPNWYVMCEWSERSLCPCTHFKHTRHAHHLNNNDFEHRNSWKLNKLPVRFVLCLLFAHLNGGSEREKTNQQIESEKKCWCFATVANHNNQRQSIPFFDRIDQHFLCVSW